MKNRRGVCQDFAHLYIGCVRGARPLACRPATSAATSKPSRRPARNASSGATPRTPGSRSSFRSHGWIDIDPTNDLIPSERHIVLRLGRDFDDVSPVRGVIVRGRQATLAVSVDVAPLAS